MGDRQLCLLGRAVKHGQAQRQQLRRVTQRVFHSLINSHHFAAMDGFQGMGGAPRGDATTPDKYVLALNIFPNPSDPQLFNTAARSFTSLHSPSSRSQLQAILPWRQAERVLHLLDAQTRTRRCAHGSHGAHARGVRGRLYRSGHRRLRHASVRYNSDSRVCRPRLPNENGRDAQADWPVRRSLIGTREQLLTSLVDRRWSWVGTTHILVSAVGSPASTSIRSKCVSPYHRSLEVS